MSVAAVAAVAAAEVDPPRYLLATCYLLPAPDRGGDPPTRRKAAIKRAKATPASQTVA